MTDPRVITSKKVRKRIGLTSTLKEISGLLADDTICVIACDAIPIVSVVMVPVVTSVNLLLTSTASPTFVIFVCGSFSCLSNNLMDTVPPSKCEVQGA